MDLVRNTTKDGFCKYALIRLDKLHRDSKFENIEQFVNKYPELKDYIEFGEPNSEEEFFVIKLKDINSTRALVNYALEADKTDQEFALQVMDLALRSGKRHPNYKQPDLLQDSGNTKTFINNFPEYEQLSENNGIKKCYYDETISVGVSNIQPPVQPEPPKGPECQYSTDDYYAPMPDEEELIKQGLKIKQPGFFEGMWLTFKSLFKLGK